MDLILYDDAAARNWRPFSLTRPAGELLYGALTLRARAERVLGARCVGHITSAHLRGFDEPGAAPVLDPAMLPADRPRLFLSARAVPAWGVPFVPPATGAVVRIGGEIVGRYAAAGTPSPPESVLLQPDGGSAFADLAGHVVRHVWQLMSGSPQQLELDIAALAPPGTVVPPVVTRPEPGSVKSAAHAVELLGPADRLHLGRDVTIEPGVVIDTTEGSIWLDDRVTVRAFTRLAGPAYVGPDSTLLGGSYTAVTIGPSCKVHGEMEETVVLGYSNKAHDGFLGHAYLGRWVNLGALTTNSDLKNTYGTIRLWTPGGEVDTREIKVGCFLGDHVKTGIGVMLNTGTVVGAGSSVFGAVQPPKHVPPFRWGAGDALGEYDLDRFLATAATVMRRRDVTLSPAMRAVLEAAWHIGREEAS